MMCIIMPHLRFGNILQRKHRPNDISPTDSVLMFSVMVKEFFVSYHVHQKRVYDIGERECFFCRDKSIVEALDASQPC